MRVHLSLNISLMWYDCFCSQSILYIAACTTSPSAGHCSLCAMRLFFVKDVQGIEQEEHTLILLLPSPPLNAAICVQVRIRCRREQRAHHHSASAGRLQSRRGGREVSEPGQAFIRFYAFFLLLCFLLFSLCQPRCPQPLCRLPDESQSGQDRLL